MFLNPTAKPTPRRTPSPRVVLPAPPGSPIASLGSGSGSGIGSSAARRITSATGSEPVDPLARREHVARRERVPQPQLDRVEPERVRELVHLRLGGEARLHGAEAAHRAARRVVRVDARRLEQRVRDRVRTARERRRVRRHRGRRGRVRAAVEQDPHAHADELPVAVRAVLGPDLRRVPVHVADERLLAVVDHLHRPARVQREQRAVDLHREVLAPAERAADAGEVDAHAARARGRGTARPGRGRRAATASRRRCRRRPRRRAPRGRTPGRGTPGPGSRARRRRRRTRRRSRPGRRGGSRGAARRSGAGRRGSRGRASSAGRGSAPAPSRAPCRPRARAARTRRGSARRRAAPARGARPRRARRARRSSARLSIASTGWSGNSSP